MDLHKKKMYDCESELRNENYEKFCQIYVSLDIDEGLNNKRLRRIKAYKLTFPETEYDDNSAINKKAMALLRNREVANRLKFLYEEIGSSIENQFVWTKAKAEDVLTGIAFDDELKTADRLNAVKQLNQMRGFDIYKEIEEDKGDSDSISKFFDGIKKFGGHDG